MIEKHTPGSAVEFYQKTSYLKRIYSK